MIYELEFGEFLKKENNSAESTINAYIADINEFELFLKTKGKRLLNCSSNDLKSFLNSLVDSGRSGSTLNRKMVSIRKYFEFLRIASYSTKNPCANVRIPKIEKKTIEYLSIEEMDKLLSMPDDSLLGLRDKALLELMYACGLKVSELTSLNIQDVDLRIGFVSCHGEKSKNRIIPIGHQARNALMLYMRDIRSQLLNDNSDNVALFLNYKGERISRQGVWKLLQFYGKKAEISTDLNPQIIRNSFAAHMIINGADLTSLQELLGNDDLSSLKIFSKLAKSRVMDVYDKTHPRA